MNSLEFIDEEIKRYKAVVSITLGDKKSYYKKVIIHLQQIKAELEAWEVVKNKGVDMPMFMLYYDNLEKYNNFIISSLEGEAYYERRLLTQQEYETLKKALEVNK